MKEELGVQDTAIWCWNLLKTIHHVLRCLLLQTSPHPYPVCKAGCNFRSCSDQNGEVCIKVLRFVLKQSRKRLPPLPVSAALEINRGALSCLTLLIAGSPLSVCSPGYGGALGQHQWCQACHEALRALSAVSAAYTGNHSWKKMCFTGLTILWDWDYPYQGFGENQTDTMSKHLNIKTCFVCLLNEIGCWKVKKEGKDT